MTVRTVDIGHSIVYRNLFPQLQSAYNLVCQQICYGCQVDHPSQIQHGVCLMMDEAERVEYYLNEALKLVDYFEERSQFDPQTGGRTLCWYVNAFLKYKQEASGWPECGTNNETKQQYDTQYKEKEDIPLNPVIIAVNKGMHAAVGQTMSQLFRGGKFGQAERIPQVTIVRDASEFYTTLFSKTKVL